MYSVPQSIETKEYLEEEVNLRCQYGNDCMDCVHVKYAGAYVDSYYCYIINGKPRVDKGYICDKFKDDEK